MKPVDFTSIDTEYTLEPGNDATSAEELRNSLISARTTTDRLFSLVKAGSLYERPIPERHRIIFYLGHLEAFDWNLIGIGQFGLHSFNSDFDQLFAFGIDPIDGALPQDLPKHWPNVDDILRYNVAARIRIDECLRIEANVQLVSAAIEHRLMHGETFAYLLHTLPHEHKQGHQFIVGAQSRQITNDTVVIPPGVATLGTERDDFRFSWDNEFDAHRVRVPEFSIQKYKVTNEEYLNFVLAGGYRERSMWSTGGWDWIQKNGISHPRFWHSKSGKWTLNTMFEEIAFQPNWPVYVSHAEADAYAQWTGRSLPTESQFHRAAFGVPSTNTDERKFPWGNTLPQNVHGNFDCQSWNPVDVDAHPAGESAFGVSGLVGNGWEWTSTPFAPFPGFKAFDFYKGYSAPFFDGQHYVLKGASPRTSAIFLRRSFRNWFQPYYPNIYASFRCVEN